MAHAYTPGLQIKPKIHYRARRMLPIAGQVLVNEGDNVDCDTVIARTEQPGEVFPVNLANALGIAPADILNALDVKPGDAVEEGQKIAESSGIFGFFKQDFHSRYTGTVESVSNVTGQMIIRGAPVPVQIDAFVRGRVSEVVPEQGAVVETSAAFLQGIFGIGGEMKGPLVLATDVPEQDLSIDRLSPEMRGAIVVAGRRMSGEAIVKARDLGVHALIAGGIDDQDLKEFLGYDLGVAITGTEELGITLIITEGFGEIAMAKATFELLQKLQGRQTSVNGATQIRAGVLRPEIVVPLDEEVATDVSAAKVGGGVLEIGSHVRLIRDPYFGKLGRVAELPEEPQVLASGSKARVLTVDCESGEQVLVPRANVELVGD